MLFRFRKMRAMDPLQVAMTGIRLGERYLQVFCDDASLTRGLATKTGLSGTAALAAPDEAHAGRARAAANKAGVLIDIQITPVATLPWPDESFDMVVVDNTGAQYESLTASARSACLQAARQTLRPGGRIEIIERTSGGLFGGASGRSPDYEQAGGAVGALTSAGFKPVRLLAEKDGFRFVEGLKG